MKASLATTQALDVFLRGFSTTRSFARPYTARQIGPSIWLMADDASNSGSERTPEMVVYGALPEEVVEARERLAIQRYCLSVLIEDAQDAATTSKAFKQQGYRLLGREPLFVLDTAERIGFDAFPVRRVTQAEDAEAVAKAARSRQILSQHLTETDSPCRLYAAFDADKPVGWVRSIRTHPDCSWVSNLFVASAYRRRGIGRSLMSAMLNEDARYGVRWSVLLASQTGAKLYPHLGYNERGLLLLFSPLKSDQGTKPG